MARAPCVLSAIIIINSCPRNLLESFLEKSYRKLLPLLLPLRLKKINTLSFAEKKVGQKQPECNQYQWNRRYLHLLGRYTSRALQLGKQRLKEVK